MEHDPIGGHAPLQGREQFPGRNGVEAKALGGHQSRDRDGTVGL
jgi:hypothetical protein